MPPIELSQEDRAQIQEIMRRMKCPKEFDCYRSGFQNTCKVESIAPGKLIERLDESGRTCVFGLSFR